MVVSVLAGVFLSAALAAQTADNGEQMLSLSVRYTDIVEIFEMLSRQGQTNIVLSNDVRGEVSINLYDVSLEEAIMAVATAGGYAVIKNRNTYIISEYDQAGENMAGGITRVKVFSLQYADPSELEETISNQLSPYGSVNVIEDQYMLVVEDLPDFLEQITGIISALDQRPVQIMIEAKILEITLTDNEEFGIDWSRLFRSSGGAGSFGVQGLSRTTAPGLFFSFVNEDIELGLNALSDKGRVRTLSTPKLLTLEHREAEVIIGDRLGYRVTTTINQVTTESVEFIESGVILKVTTYIDESGHIMMDIHPEVSTGNVTGGIPSISTTEVSTQLLAEDGQTIFIGGLIRNTTSETRTGVPLLGDLPVLGRLFSNNIELTTDTETIVLITPHVIHGPRIMEEFTGAPKVLELGENLEQQADAINRKFESPR